MTMKAASILLAAGVLLAGCATNAPPPDNALQGGEWRLAQLKGESVEPGSRATLAFPSKTSVSGSGGCNNFVGAVAADQGRLSLGQLAATRKACPGAVMKLEDDYLAALSQATGYRLDGEELVLLDASGTAILRFEPIN